VDLLEKGLLRYKNTNSYKLILEEDTDKEFHPDRNERGLMNKARYEFRIRKAKNLDLGGFVYACRKPRS
jgi:hypothetical protein